MNNDPDREVAVFNEVLQLRIEELQLGERAAHLDKPGDGKKTAPPQP